MRIHISTPIDDASRIVTLFRHALPAAQVGLVEGSIVTGPDPAQADYVVTGYRNATLFYRERRMKAIFAFSVGVGHLLSLPNLPRDVPLIRLEDGAHLINIGRGAHLIEADLLALLAAGKLSGATLDVFHDEPLPADHPFWTRPEIAITPHISGVTLPDHAVAQIADKIQRLERGLPVTGVVDRERGY
jgi:hypothetical protein